MSLQNPPWLLLLFLTFLFTKSQCAINYQADQDIRKAIKQAVYDGLSTINSFLHRSYWFYLNKIDCTMYDVSVQSRKLNYRIIYKCG